MALLNATSVGDDGVSDGYMTERPEELDAWLFEAAAQLSDAERAFNRLALGPLGAMLLPQRQYASFEEYLEALAASPAAELRQRAIAALDGTPAEILHDEQRYIAHVARRYPNDPLSPRLLHDAYALLCDPDQLKDSVLGHLHMLWERLFAEEWRRRHKLIGALANMLHDRVLPRSSAPDVVHAVIGRTPPPATIALLAGARRIVVVPTPHTALYVSQFDSADTVWVFVAVSTITSWTLRQSPIKSSEVMMRLNPLADETRLRILELLAQHGELSSQDLIGMLGISQSGVSRHLKALGSYIIERRGEGATKYYQLNPGYLDWTFVTLRRFLTAAADLQPAPQPRDLTANARGFAPSSGQPVGPSVHKDQRQRQELAELRRFMDREGRITSYPTRRRDQLMMLEYLASKLEPNRSYTEKEINEILRAQLDPHYDDFVTLRRELYNWQFVDRERDGSRYWRLERAATD
jgi:hypothetical protein